MMITEAHTLRQSGLIIDDKKPAPGWATGIIQNDNSGAFSQALLSESLFNAAPVRNRCRQQAPALPVRKRG